MTWTAAAVRRAEKSANHVVATSLLTNLIERRLRVDESILFVIDGGKGLRKALRTFSAITP